ncbi:MAG: hypothetical protein K6C95_09260 [Lachnospiraceae bacterium]|nr:hypothetical protein [Lachnospiraceae bacterium]
MEKSKSIKVILSSIIAGSMIMTQGLSVLAAPPAKPGSGGFGGSSSSQVVYSAAHEITDSGTTLSGNTFSSDTGDKIALLVTASGTTTLKDITVTKTGDSDGGDNCNFYGQNASVLVKDGGTLNITGGTITSGASGANGAFCYGGNGGQNGSSGDGTTLNISGVTITTTGSGSGGIMTTGGGVTNATDLTVTTSGQSSAPIRTDRGGGTVTVNGGTYTSSGLGSPVIYSTADITVNNATLVSHLSEGVCIEGTNSITLNGCDLTASNSKTNGHAQYLDTIMIYQSMSGDASGTDSSFNMTGGTLTSKSGHVFHVTNTGAEINLNDVTIINEDTGNILLSVCNDGWSGNRNSATLNAVSQTLGGGIIVSSKASSASNAASSLKLNIDSASIFSGYIGDESGSDTNLGTVDMTLDGTWVLTKDSYVTSLSGSGKINYGSCSLHVGDKVYTEASPYSSLAVTTENGSTDTDIDTENSDSSMNTGSGNSSSDSQTSAAVGNASVTSKNVNVTLEGTKYTVNVTVNYNDSVSYKGLKIDPEKDLSASIDMSGIKTLIDSRLQTGVSDNLLSVRYMAKKAKNASSSAFFYPVISFHKTDARDAGLTAKDVRAISNTIKKLNSSLKKKKCGFTINKIDLSESSVTVCSPLGDNGQLTLTSKGKLPSSHTVSVISVQGDSFTLTKKQYKITVIDETTATVKITGKGTNFTGYKEMKVTAPAE